MGYTPANTREIFDALILKKNPLDLEELDNVDMLGHILGSKAAARSITMHLIVEPEIWQFEPGVVAQRLKMLPHVGPSIAARYVLLMIWHGRMKNTEIAA